MKARTRNILIALGCLLVGLSIGAANQERIRWTYENPPWYYSTDRMQRVQFGLRNDGVVVWREIVPASSATTNSPAEQFEMGTITNMVMTNKLYGDWGLWTNIIQPFPRIRIGTNGFYYEDP